MSRTIRNGYALKPARRLGMLAVLVLVLCLAAGISGAGTGNATRSSVTEIDPVLVQKLRETARGSVAVATNKSTSFASFIKVGLNGDLRPSRATESPGGKAQAFLREFGALLGISNADTELVELSSAADNLGATHVSYEQVYRGVPVWGSSVRVHFDNSNNLTAVNGVVVPDISLDTNARLSAAQAAERAIAAVRSDPPADQFGARAQVGNLQAESSKLYVYRMGLVRGIPGTNQLAYEVVVTNGSNIRDVLIVHAHAGKVLNRYSTIDDALSRRLFEGFPPVQVWVEGDPFPGSLNGDQQNIVNFSGHSYYHFFNAFGRDSYNGAGAEMQSVNNDPRIACPNANWNGITTNYCTGVTADDVVAHEWAHAYTEYTHNLIYQWQPGALNESYSDIWGELVDQINGAGTDDPSPVRSDGLCSTHTAGRPLLTINSPPAIAGDCPTAGALFGPTFSPTGITGNVVLALDEVGPGDPSTENGCTAFTNAGAVSGNIALVYRGACTFVTKVANAQNAGAVAVIVANNVPGAPPFVMGGGGPIGIPSAMTTFEHGNLIKGQLSLGPVNVTIRDVAGPREDSYRWLIGEDATAFGAPGRHAIRDMWSPTCLSDPGKVTDAEYHCDTSDAGGVHTNSGVPNHAFALLIDGGSYNGQTISSIGLVKAAHLYWRAQSVYQTRTSDFDDHANALEASCADLVAAGTNLEGLSTSSTPAGPSGQIMTAADCTEVTEVIAAVELRTDPTAQCNFTPLLDKNPPPVCGDQQAQLIRREHFEGRSGFAGWSRSNEGVYSGWPGLNWTPDSTLPGGDRGTAAFAPDPDAGNCDQNGGDISGVMRLVSPAMRIPSGEFLSLRLKFEHYVATEFEFDGGNVKISINGGPYTLVPTDAFLFNPYNTEALQPTNPLADEPGFSGTDGGIVFGSWGSSHVDLTQVGVRPGDVIRVRFDFGIDGCAGIDGWYVDDITVWGCKGIRDNPAGNDRVVASHRH